MTNAYPGQIAPDFELTDDKGRIVTLSALSGKPVAIFVYPQDGTPSCTNEAIDFSALAGAFRRAGIVLFGLSPDSVEKHRRFKAKHGLQLSLLSDPDRRMIEPWGCWGEKETFGRKYLGVIRSTFLIDREGRIAEAWRGVRVAGHAQTVLDAGRRLAVGTSA